MKKSALAAVDEGPDLTAEPAILPIRLVNTADLRKRRAMVAAAVAEAADEVEQAEGRLRELAREIAAAPRHSPTFTLRNNSERIEDERESAAAELRAQTAALALLDEELKIFDDPARKREAAVARSNFKTALQDYFGALDKIEVIVKGDLRSAIEAALACRKAAAETIGATTLGVAGDIEGEGGFLRLLSELAGGSLHGILNGQTFGFYCSNGIAHDRPWRDCEASRLAHCNADNLE